MNTSESRLPVTASQCEHLGIESDPATCLAYPSSWNYCQRARPPASVGLAHQKQYCQSTWHVRCVVFDDGRTGPLPAEIRGSHPSTTQRPRTRALVPAWLVTLALAVSLLGFLGVPALLRGAAPQLSSEVRPVAPLTATPGPALSTATAAPTTVMPVIPFVAATFPTPTDFSSTGVVSQRPPPMVVPIATRVSACGHQLDEPFGFGRKFIVHRVQYGDSLSAYETTYRTNLAAIEGVNGQLLIPLRPNQIIVIPVDQKAIDEVPLLEAYELSERNTTAGKIAEMLASSNLDEFLRYNAINTTCPIFSGWVLAPRSRPAP